MMSFNVFKKYMLDLKKYFEYENKLNDLGINIWEREEVSHIITDYVNLIANSFNLSESIELDYFLYEVHGLEDIPDADVPEPWDSLEHLYKFLVECGCKGA